MYTFPYLEPVCCSMSSSNCCFLTCIQISQEAGQVVWYSHLFQNFPQFVVIHTVKGFGIVNKAEVDVFLELSCFFWWSNGCWQFAFSKSSLNIWKFTVHVVLKPGLENFEHYFASIWDKCNCVVQFSSVVSNSLRPHESQHTRPPCSSPTPGVHPDSGPLSPWCHPAISSSVVPFSSCPQSLPASESFSMSQLF